MAVQLLANYELTKKNMGGDKCNIGDIYNNRDRYIKDSF